MSTSTPSSIPRADGVDVAPSQSATQVCMLGLSIKTMRIICIEELKNDLKEQRAWDSSFWSRKEEDSEDDLSKIKFQLYYFFIPLFYILQ